jgi:hypothetical protein
MGLNTCLIFSYHIGHKSDKIGFGTVLVVDGNMKNAAQLIFEGI